MLKASLQILGLERGATQQQAKAAYRRLTAAYHPDRNPGDRHAEEMFKLVCNAYKMLLPELPSGADSKDLMPLNTALDTSHCRRKRRGTRSERRFNWQLAEDYIGTQVNCQA
ncbi:J domain-containing protein [Teredinibacter purpureus]|uniref:J domain-containing protein n=1 Tax=Teredinibacter purpureus TaxID=2731756 RepID=UPI0005F7CF9A|nr:J domain-containing protein [Teredinibacter purpureus]